MWPFSQLLKIGNPNHAANGEFASSPGSGGGAGAAPRAPLPNGKHHGENAKMEIMASLQVGMPRTFARHQAFIAGVVDKVLREHPAWSTGTKALTIFGELKNSGEIGMSGAVSAHIPATRGNPIYDRMTAALNAHEIRPGYNGAAMNATLRARAGAATPTAAPAARSPVAGPSAATSTARAMSSPQAASVAAPAPAPAAVVRAPVATVANLKAAGFVAGYDSDYERVAQDWAPIFGNTTPKEVMDTMFKDKLGDNFKVDIRSSGGVMKLNVNNASVSITRQLSRKSDGSVNVDHSYFKVASNSERGQGFGKKFLSNSMELYKKIGVSTIDVHANIDVGGYAWAKYGFVPNANSWSSMARDFSSKVQATPVDSEFTVGKKEAMLRQLKNPDPKTAWDFADNPTTKGGKAVAKAAMLGSNWYGVLDLKNPTTMERFNDYVTKAR